MNEKSHTTCWVVIGAVFIIIMLLYNKYFPDCWGKVSTTDIILIVTGIAVFRYTSETNKIRKQSALNQNLIFMSELIKSYNSMRDKFPGIYLGDPTLFMTRDFNKCAEMSNFLDGVGQIIFHLSETQQDIALQNIALERWAEIYIRFWIRLRDFVHEKRDLSIKRDYPYFEWLACRSLEFHDERFRDMDINFYKYNLLREKYVVSEINVIDNNRHRFRKSRQVVVDLIRSRNSR